MFQHGLCGAASQPAEAFPQNSGWSCVTLECRGHGGSQAGDSGQFSLATFADDVVGLIEAQKIGPCPVGGISMGAAIALRLAVKRPDLVSALVLARPAWSLTANPPNNAANLFVGQLLREHPPLQALKMFGASAIAKELETAGPDNLVSLLSFFRREPVSVTAELLCRIAADGPGVTADELARIKIPTLVIGNDLDAIHPLVMARELAGLIPGASLVEITPKAVSKEKYLAEFKVALADFLIQLVD